MVCRVVNLMRPTAPATTIFGAQLVGFHVGIFLSCELFEGQNAKNMLFSVVAGCRKIDLHRKIQLHKHPSAKTTKTNPFCLYAQKSAL